MTSGDLWCFANHKYASTVSSCSQTVLLFQADSNLGKTLPPPQTQQTPLETLSLLSLCSNYKWHFLMLAQPTLLNWKATCHHVWTLDPQICCQLCSRFSLSRFSVSLNHFPGQFGLHICLNCRSKDFIRVALGEVGCTFSTGLLQGSCP